MVIRKKNFACGADSGSMEFRGALSAVSANLALGLLPFCGAVLFMGPGHVAETMMVLLAGLVSATVARLFHEHRPENIRTWNANRALSCLLLGASFAVMPWMHHKLPLAMPLMILCFSLRWLLFALETWQIERADRMKLPLPSLSARIRRTITWITGAVIPILIACGASAVPLLLLSFALTWFCQWAANVERFRDFRLLAPSAS